MTIDSEHENENETPILYICDEQQSQNTEISIKPFSEHPPIPLSHAWTFYFEAPPKYIPKHAKDKKNNTKPKVEEEEEEEDRLKSMYTFSSVQDFWGLINNIPQINSLSIKSSYHLMQKGVEPRWEDPFNERGGIWTVRIPKEHTVVFWRNLLLATIGGRFFSVLSEDDEIAGVSFGARKVDGVFMVWNKKGDIDENYQNKLFEVIESCLPESDMTIQISFYKKNNDHTDFATKK